MNKTIVVHGVEFEVKWDGTQCRPDSHTKGELLGPYESQTFDARLHIFNRGKKRPMDTEDDNR